MFGPKAAAIQTGPSTWEVRVPGVDHNYGVFVSKPLADLMVEALNNLINGELQKTFEPRTSESPITEREAIAA